MSEQENLDIGKVVSLIMQNPDLIEQISSLAKNMPKESPEEIPQKEEDHTEVKEEEKNVEAVAHTYVPHPPTGKQNRAQLLCALKPYVSKERAKAIDSMISIADILDMMKGR